MDLKPHSGYQFQRFVEGVVDLAEFRSLIRRPVGQSAITPFLPVFPITFGYLLEMAAHRLPGGVRVSLLDGFEELAVRCLGEFVSAEPA